MRKLVLIGLLAACSALAACGSRPPAQVANACAIFEDKSAWRRDTDRVEDRWGVSPGTQLAFVRRESSFVHDARPPRGKFLFIFPGARPSSAQGYAQALDTTWAWYQRDTGRRGASRRNFGDAVDFIGWYATKSRQISGISLNDPRSLYLAYHEGHGGYNRGTWRSKGWLQDTAAQVEHDARTYDSQLEACPRRRRWGIF